MADRRYVYTPIPFLDWKPEETADLTALFNIIGDEDLDTDVCLASKVEGIIASERSHSVEKIKERIPTFPQLKAIASVAAGYDYYYPQLKAFGIPIANCPDVHTDATADHAMSLLLAAGCGLLAGLRATILSERPHFLYQGYRSSGISGATLGIVGLGRIGSAIARRARGFDMQVLYHSRRQKSEEEEQEAGVKRYCDTLNDMLPNSDYVVAACSLNEQTHRMFSKPQFMMMKHSATFVNISRGKVVDTDALVEVLRTGKIRQAALDVTDPEPLPPGHPLLGLDNVIITPHMAVTTIRGITGCLSTVAKNLKAAIVDGKKMPNVISEINSPKV